METLSIRDFFTISGSRISEIYQKNRMTVHFQGMSKTLLFPQTIGLQGAPTCSIGISPEGLYNRLNDAGRLILLNSNALQFASAPFIRIGEKTVMLTTRDPRRVEGVDDVPALKNYYHPPVPEECVSISIAFPLLELVYTLEEVCVSRRFVCPFLSRDSEALMPLSVEEYEVENRSGQRQEITLVIVRPSLVNLQEKELKPTDQDTVYLCSTPVKGHRHRAFGSKGLFGVVMSSTECADRMVLAVPAMKGTVVDTQPYFCLNRLKQDLLLNEDGRFYEKRGPMPHQDYGAAISVSFALEPNEKRTIPVAIVLDFPQQRYIDGKTFERKYVKSFRNPKTRAMEMTKLALTRYPAWKERIQTIHQRLWDLIRQSPSYRNDPEGARRLLRLIVNEFSFPLSNACVWVEDEEGRDRARFLECFDYAYINPSDVDWYSMVLLALFPEIEMEICQRFIDSIQAEDPRPRWYHFHASFTEARQHFEKHPEEYEGVSLTQIRDAFKVKGSVAHDLGALPKGHALRNVSDYAWYNNNYWIDLYPKLVLRVLRNIKFTGNLELLEKNWETLKFGFDALMKLDADGDGIPEGNPDEVKNTFDNLTLFGVDSYDVTIFMAGCYALIRLAELMKDQAAAERYRSHLKIASEAYEKLWADVTNPQGRRLQYSITCYDPVTGNTNTDVWTNQLDALWYLLSIGEEPFLSDERARQILRTIYENNRSPMGWAMAKTREGQRVQSEQGQDVYTTSNYVFAQLLDYYGMTEESKDVYRVMDRVVFEYGNSLITPDNLRAELEQEEGETAPGPHYIVAAYPRPGAILSHLVLEHVKHLQEQTGRRVLDGALLKSFLSELIK